MARSPRRPREVPSRNPARDDAGPRRPPRITPGSTRDRLASRVQRAGRMELCQHRIDPPDDTPDVASALCHELHLPLGHLLDSLERAHETLRRRPAATPDQPTLQLLRCLADAHSTARHLLRVVADVHGHARAEPRHTRRLDLRAAVRAAATMVQPPDGDIAIDAPDAAWVDGVDTRLVHVFAALFTEALEQHAALVVRVRAVDGDVVVELRGDAVTARPPLPPSTHAATDERSRALARAVVGHVVAAHGGRLERRPLASPGVAARVTLPAAPRISFVSLE